MEYKILNGWESERLISAGIVLFVSSVLCSVFGHKWRNVMYVKDDRGIKLHEQCYRCWETQKYDKTVINTVASDLQENG